MHLSLGGIVKGITTGLTTLAETGNPVIAAGAGAISCLASSNASANAPANTAPAASPLLSPLLEELQAENPYERQNVNALSSYADLVAA
jgi:hypothetical protein